MRYVAAFALLSLCPTLVAQGSDLAKRYRATLDYEKAAGAREWTCGAEDVWALKKFRWQLGKRLRIELGPGNVVFGKHGSNVVWAVLFPDKPAKLRSKVAGDGESITSIWMRFHPALVGELFPRKTVKGQGPAGYVAKGKRIYRGHINSSWQSGNQPIIPWKKSLVLDCNTTAGMRRFFMVDTEAKTVKYEPAFLNRCLPALAKTSAKRSLAAFEAAWKAFDREYAMFGLLPRLDWDKAKRRHRKQAAAARTTFDTGIAIAGLLAELEDLHVYVKVGDEFIPGYTRKRPMNANWRGATKVIGGVQQTKHDLVWGRTADGIGYVNVYGLSDQEAPRVFDEALEKLSDTWALVLDLRFNGGGDELLARSMAGRFLAQSRIYSVNQYRSGSKHDQLGRKLARECQPRGPWRYAAPVICLVGQRTMSSAESFALMMAQAPQVTTMGDRTAGSSGNPRRLTLDGNITVNLPRWLDATPDGKPIEHVGVAPDVAVEFTEASFSDSKDDVLARALSQLRKTAKAKRRPGRRSK